jgi:hypothetical protein
MVDLRHHARQHRFPGVTLRSNGDNSLMGSIPNGVNNYSLDLPDYNGAPLELNGNPRNGCRISIRRRSA